jgi:hypothetical protein
MAGGFTQINPGPVAVQVCPPLGKGESVTLYNSDPLNVVTVGTRPNVAQNDSNAAPIQPLTNAVLPAEYALYAVAPKNTGALVVLPDGGSISPSPGQIALNIAATGLAKDTTLQGTTSAVNGVTATLGAPAQDGTVAGVTTAVGGTTTAVNGVPAGIAVAGVPLLSANDSVISSSGSIAVSGTFTSAVTAIPQIGYEVFVELNASVLETGSAISTVTMTWTDPSTGLVIDVDQFFIAPGVTPGQCLVVGSGPTKAGNVQVKIANGGALGAMTYQFQMLQNSRVYSREDWHSLSATGNPLIAATNSSVASGLIASSSISIVNGTTVNRLLPLYAGEVQFCIIPPAQTGQVGIQTLDQNAPVANLIALEQLVASTPLNFTHALSRAQCQLNIKNTGAATGTFQVLATIVETPG